jgi:hypothetical protein
MKRAMILILILTFVISLTLIAGCGDGDEEEKEGSTVKVTEEEASPSEGAEAGEEENAEVIEEDGQKITVEESQGEEGGGTVTLEGEDGEQSTIEVQDQVPSEEALGAPIYPGSEYVEGSGISGKTTQGDKTINATGAEFTTADAITKVVDWYKGKIGAPMASSPETATWMIQDPEGAIVTVIVELFEDRVKITIAKVSGDIDMDINL